MLKLDDVTYFRRTVAVQQPRGDKPNQTEAQHFTAKFRILDMEDLEELTRKNRAEDESDLSRIRECLDKVLEGVEGVGDAKGEAFEADKALELVKRVSHVAIAAHQEYWKGVNEMGGIKRKN